MLEVTDDSSVLPGTGLTATTLNGFVSTVPNLVNGYNIAEQTCFHKTTVTNLKTSLEQLSASYKSLAVLLGDSTDLATDCKKLVDDLKALVGNTATLVDDAGALVTNAKALVGDGTTPGAATTLVGDAVTLAGGAAALVTNVTTLVGPVVGPGIKLPKGNLISLVATLTAEILSTRKNLEAIRDAANAAAIAAIIAGALFIVSPHLAGVGVGVLLAAVFFVIKGKVSGLLGTVMKVEEEVTPLAAPLTAIAGDVVTVARALTSLVNPAPPPAGSLATVAGALSDLGTSLGKVEQSLAEVKKVLSGDTLPSDVTASLDKVITASLPEVQKSLGAYLEVVAGTPATTPPTKGTATILDERIDFLGDFLNLSGTTTPRLSLEDTLIQAKEIYKRAVDTLSPPTAAALPLWQPMVDEGKNKPQIEPGASAVRDLLCADHLNWPTISSRPRNPSSRGPGMGASRS
jgi:hypothetical protein